MCFLIDEGYYQGGKFQFETEVPDAYNMVVSSPRLSRCSPFLWRVAVTGPGSPPALCPSAAHPVLGLSTRWLTLVWLMPLISILESVSGEVPFLNKCLRVPCASMCWGAALPGLELPPPPRLAPLQGAAWVFHANLVRFWHWRKEHFILNCSFVYGMTAQFQKCIKCAF